MPERFRQPLLSTNFVRNIGGANVATVSQCRKSRARSHREPSGQSPSTAGDQPPASVGEKPQHRTARIAPQYSWRLLHLRVSHDRSPCPRPQAQGRVLARAEEDPSFARCRQARLDFCCHRCYRLRRKGADGTAIEWCIHHKPCRVDTGGRPFPAGIELVDRAYLELRRLPDAVVRHALPSAAAF